MIMNEYIKESMAMVGCGASDTREIANICSNLSEIEWDTLDAMYSFGADTTLTEAGEAARANLKADNSDDDLICLAAYVNAHRNTIGAYAN